MGRKGSGWSIARWGVACVAGALLAAACITSQGTPLGQGAGSHSGGFSSAPIAAGDTPVVPAEHGYSFGASLARSLGGLFICLGIFGAGIKVYTRFGLRESRVSRARLTLIERVQLSPKSALHLVALDGKEFVVATGAEPTSVIVGVKEPSAQFEESLLARTNAEAERYSQILAEVPEETIHV